MKEIVYSDNLNDVNWEHSSVREWLNLEFKQKHFTTSEINNMVGTNPSMSNVTDEEDPIFLLSQAEMKEYAKLIKPCHRNQWLRDVVEQSSNVYFVNLDGVVMTSGYPANSNQFSVRPAFWYSL